MTRSVPTAALVAFLAASTVHAVPPEDPVSRQRVARGEYLVSIMGCNDCHTPLKMGPKGPEPDFARMLSGHPETMGRLPAAPVSQKSPWIWSGAATNTAFTGPWGVTYAVNLTPDPTTGLGGLTEDNFVKAIRTGKHYGQANARDIQAPMPWPAYRFATEEDLRSIHAFLRTLRPIKNRVPEYQPPKGQQQVASR